MSTDDDDSNNKYNNKNNNDEKKFLSSILQQRNNNIYLSMVQSVLQTSSFYFSCTYDLTHTLQRLSRTSPDFLQMPLFERVWAH